MKIQSIDIEELKPYGSNPRSIGKDAIEAVKASIERFGFRVPVLVDKDHIIIAGHTRLLAARELGMEKVPCIVADDLTEEQAKALRLADNKVGELAQWDVDLLEKELAELGDLEIDMTDFGFELENPEEEKESPDDLSSFHYQSQYGVIVMCKSEDEQKEVYERLLEEGFECKVVCT